MIFNPGDDVIVTFEDTDARGVVVSHLRGWVTAVIEIDPAWDYGSITSRLSPQSTVCVREGNVRLAATGDASTASSGYTPKPSE